MRYLYYPKSFVRRVKAAFPGDKLLHKLLDEGSKEVGAHLEELEQEPSILTQFHAEWKRWADIARPGLAH